MSRSQVIMSLVAVPLLVLLVACGGDKKDSSSSSNDGGSSNSSASNSNSGGGSSNSGGGATTSNDGALSLENCKAYASMEAAATQAFGTTSNFKLDEKALNDLAKNSPSEIRSDMTLVVGTIIEVFKGFEKLGVNFNNPSSFATLDAAKLAEFEKLGAKFDDKKFTDASERIEKYFVSKCS
jgi:hypothetical protein